MNTKTMRFAAVLLIVACGVAEAEGDLIYRPEFELKGNLPSDFGWIFTLEPHLTNNIQRAGELALIPGVKHKTLGFLNLGFEFFYISKGADDLSNELRPRFNLELVAKTGPMTLELASRTEYRIKEGNDNYVRERVRLRAKFPRVLKGQAYMYDEVFYEFGDIKELNGQELGFGIKFKLPNKVVSAGPEVRIRHGKSGGAWGKADVYLLSKVGVSI